MAKERKTGKRMSSLTVQILLAVISVVIAAALLFVPQIDAQLLCRAFCIVLLAGGAAAVVYFFATGGYRKLREYNFALGVLLLLLGICGLIRADALAASFVVASGFVVLVLGILMLQNTVQLTVLGSRLNIASFILTLLTLFGAMTVLAGWKAVLDTIAEFPQISLLVAGVFSLASLIMTAAVIRRSDKLDAMAAAAANEFPHPEPEDGTNPPDSPAQ